MAIKTEEAKNLDFSKMEVILRRGVKGSKRAPIIIFFIVVILIFWGLATLFFYNNNFKLTFMVILFYAIPVVVSPLFITNLAKFHHNKKLAHDNLYYDAKSKKFYLETSKGEIKSIDAKDEMRVGNNMVGFDETVVVYDGERINTGYSKSDLNAANRRIEAIRNSL